MFAISTTDIRDTTAYNEFDRAENVVDETPADIWAFARCNDGTGHLSEVFFSDDLYDIARAKSICGKCPVRADCLAGALDRAEPWGVWGGELFLSGKIHVKTRGRGRPPKNPRPVLVIDEVRVQVPVRKSA